MGALRIAAGLEVPEDHTLVSPCSAHSGRFDMAGGRDWLYVETDQPHSTRVMAFF